MAVVEEGEEVEWESKLDRRRGLPSLLATFLLPESLSTFLLAAGSDSARSCEPRGVGSALLELPLVVLVFVTFPKMSAAVGGRICVADAFMASLRLAERSAGGILTRPILFDEFDAGI